VDDIIQIWRSLMKKITRRKFLSVSLAGAAAGAFTVSGQALGAGNFMGYPEGMGVLVDLTRCIGCRTCEAACNREQALPEPVLSFDDTTVFDQVFHGGQKRRTDENAFTVVNRYDQADGGSVYRKIQCNHCNEPACLTSCFVNAYTKTKEGAVIYNSKVCVGCRACMTACPFRIPAYRYSSATNPVIRKCIFCYDTRLKYGKPPACVDACPQGVLTFGHRKNLLKIADERIRTNPDRYVDYVYGESEVGGTAWIYLSGVPFENVDFDVTIQKEPILNNAQDFLSQVPMVLAIWPALFLGFHRLSTRGEEDGDENSNLSDREESQS
jgi:Fe-S-cluster-containing dehydrogenase component